MPTINVGPGSGLALQEIADTLGKSRKVVVVTGAGISTNCGIPDFRSENGLYSLIQAQYDAALQNPPWENTDNFDIDDRPKKKRRVTDRWYYEIVPGNGPEVQDTNNQRPENAEPGSPRSQSASRTITSRSTPAARRSPDSSPLSSPRSITPPLPSDFKIEDSSILPPPTRSSFAPVAPSRSRSLRSESSRSSSVFTGDDISKETLSQSDSSAPSCSAKTDETTSTTEPDQEPQFPSSPPSRSSDSTSRDSTQPSQSTAARTLPNLKGRDLFDSMIWSDPFTTSIFYMFISSLREKIQNDVKTTTITHKFIRTLRDGGRLVRNYTQNIDSLEQREGLCTEIARGPGNKARFHAKTQREPRPGVIDGESPHNGGAEVVLLHGNLVSLRCGICGKLCNWDSDDRQSTTLSGSAPDCPSCTEYNARRRGGGRRELAVGRLRPDVVLYGEEHPNANLIAPLITHDLSLGPDFLLIMGTSLRVHGLKVMVKEFAKAVHVKGGKVVFVNQTKPPESTWGEFIDYWVEWDCDEWVMDLQERRADIWLPQGSQMEMNRKESASDTKMEKTSKGSRTQVSRPQAVRDDKLNGVYQTFKILDSLRQIADSSGKISDRPIYWEKTGRTIIAPVKVEPSKQSRKSLPASRNTSKEANSKKRKSYPITLPNEKSIEEVAEVWDRLRKIAPGLGAAPPASGRIALEELHRNRGFPVQHMYTNITRSFPDQSANRFPWLDGLTLLTHPPSGAEPPIHAPKRIEKPAVMARPVNHAYGTRSSTRQSGISAESAMPAPLSEISNGNTTIVVVGTFSRPSLPLQISDANNTIVVDTPTCLSPSDMSNGSATIIVDNNPSQHSLPSSPSTEDEIVVAAPSTKVEKPPTPPTSDPMTPSAQRIKRMGSLGAILSSPEDGSRSSGSAGTVYYDAEEA